MKDIFQCHFLPFTAILLKVLPADYYAMSERITCCALNICKSTNHLDYKPQGRITGEGGGRVF